METKMLDYCRRAGGRALVNFSRNKTGCMHRGINVGGEGTSLYDPLCATPALPEWVKERR